MDGLHHETRRIGEQIRRLRRQKGWTQQELADQAGLFDVGELERGYRARGGKPVNPHIESLSKVATALGVTLGELFGEPPPDETACHIAELLDDQSPQVKRQALRIIRALVAE